MSRPGHESPERCDGQTLRIPFPEEGLRFDDLVLRLPGPRDLQGLAAAFDDGELNESENIAPFGRDEVAQRLRDSPTLIRLVVSDAETGDVLGGGTLHHHDPKRSVIEIGYWLLPRARGRGVATKVARALSEHAFALGLQRVAAYVEVGNVASERVLERAGFTREGVVRSLPKSEGHRVDKTLFSLLPGE